MTVRSVYFPLEVRVIRYFVYYISLRFYGITAHTKKWYLKSKFDFQITLYCVSCYIGNFISSNL